MPPELVKAASDVIVTAAMEPAVQERMRQIGFQPLGLRQPEFTSFFQTERARWKEVVDKAGIKL
jgi:tripartite-type tricarboxylate transporter receptor subunit TctC